MREKTQNGWEEKKVRSGVSEAYNSFKQSGEGQEGGGKICCKRRTGAITGEAVSISEPIKNNEDNKADPAREKMGGGEKRSRSIEVGERPDVQYFLHLRGGLDP